MWSAINLHRDFHKARLMAMSDGTLLHHQRLNNHPLTPVFHLQICNEDSMQFLLFTPTS